MSQFSDKDFDQMQAAVLNTARGRWFLAEHAKRHRAADTETLLEAIGKLERGIALRARGAMPVPVLSELDEIQKSLALARQELTTVVPEITEEIAGRKARDALARLDQAEARLDGLIGAYASPMSVAEEPKAGASVESVQARNRVGIVRAAPNGDKGPPAAPSDRIQVVRGKSSDETRIPLVEDAPDASAG